MASLNWMTCGCLNLRRRLVSALTIWISCFCLMKYFFLIFSNHSIFTAWVSVDLRSGLICFWPVWLCCGLLFPAKCWWLCTDWFRNLGWDGRFNGGMRILYARVTPISSRLFLWLQFCFTEDWLQWLRGEL